MDDYQLEQFERINEDMRNEGIPDDVLEQSRLLKSLSSMSASFLAELLGIFPRSSYGSHFDIIKNIKALLLEVGKYSSNEWPDFYGHSNLYYKQQSPGDLLKSLMLEFLKHQETDYLHKLYSTYRFHNGPVVDMAVLASRNEHFYRDFKFCYLCDNTWPRMSFRHYDDEGNQVVAGKESRVLLDLVLPLWDTQPETFFDSMKDRPVGHSGDLFVQVRENGSVSVSDKYFYRDLSFYGGVERLFDFEKAGLRVGPLSFEDVSGCEFDYGGAKTFLVRPLYDSLLVREARKLVDIGIERDYGLFDKSRNKMESVLDFLADCEVHVTEDFKKDIQEKKRRSNAKKMYKSFASAKKGAGQKKKK